MSEHHDKVFCVEDSRYPSPTQLICDEIDQLPCIYVLFHCLVCGIPWEEHKSSCCRHYEKNNYINYRYAARNIDKYKSLFDLASQNGWKPTYDVKAEIPSFKPVEVDVTSSTLAFEKAVEEWASIASGMHPGTKINMFYDINHKLYRVSLSCSG